jgi:hypothetical protein
VRHAARSAPAAAGLAQALAGIAAGADARDRAPAFPEEAMRLLERAGALAPGGDDWELVRRVARADASVGRILDGHLNGVERLTLLAEPRLRAAEVAALARGARRIGVWGADPVPGEGPPARLSEGRGAARVDGVKVFCSGAGGVDRALVTVRGDAAAPLLAYVDVTRGVEVDRAWFRGSGLRASESHRVVFRGAPVVAVLGEPGELGRDPWFSLDAMRTAACWVGMGEAAAEAALAGLAARGEPDDLAGHAAGRIAVAVESMQACLDRAAAVAGRRGADLRAASVHLRAAVDGACREILDAARAAGSRPLVCGGGLDRCRRDLELFLLQHRLEPMVAAVGRDELARRR